ncbi:hypothetical protein ARMSODRAFT_964141, partial [Armillaria solidipes]
MCSYEKEILASASNQTGELIGSRQIIQPSQAGLQARGAALLFVRSQPLPTNLFDSPKHVFSILNNEPYIPSEAPDHAPNLNAHERDKRFLLALLGKPCDGDRKDTEERKILWCLVHHDKRTEPGRISCAAKGTTRASVIVPVVM